MQKTTIKEIYQNTAERLENEYLTAENINNKYTGLELFVMAKSLVWMRIAINDQEIETRRN